MRIAIVEDQQDEIARLERYLERLRQEVSLSLETDAFQDPVQFLESYRLNYDLILLDIRMPGMTGMEVAQRIRQKDTGVEIVFITSLAQYAIDGYRVQALDYLLKPVTYFEFRRAMDRALKKAESNKEESILLQVDRQPKRVTVSDILYLESADHKLSVHLAGGDSMTCWCTLSALLEQLPQGQFSRINSGTAVNLQAVDGLRGDDVRLINGVTLPVSRRQKKLFCTELAAYFGGHS